MPEPKRFTLQFFVTDQCNLRCRYCYEETQHRKNRISWSTMQSTMERVIPALEDYDEVHVDLIGGEPLLAFDLIQKTVEFLKQRETEWGRKFIVFASTNGTVLDEEMKDWFWSNRERVVLGLSLDGTKMAHDFNRSNSYDLIEKHLEFFARTWPRQPVKMTINPEVVDEIHEGIQNIYSRGLTCSANVVFEDVWRGKNRQELLRKFAYQLDKVADYFGDNPHLEPPGLVVDLPIGNLVAPLEDDWTWCGAGSSMMCVNHDGKEYSCHRFANTFGEIEVPAGDRVNEKCSSCDFFGCCPTCDAFNAEVHGSSQKKTDFHCDLMKIQALATAKLKYKRLYYRFADIHKGEGGLEELARIRQDMEAVLFVNEHMDQDILNLFPDSGTDKSADLLKLVHIES